MLVMISLFPVYVDEDLRKNYKIEDFLWSGSGDGENETELPATEEQATWERTTTVFHTTTIISTSTVFYNSLSTVISVSIFRARELKKKRVSSLYNVEKNDSSRNIIKIRFTLLIFLISR